MKYHLLAPLVGLKHFYQKPPAILKTQKKALFFWYLYHIVSYVLVLISLLRLIFKKKEHKGYTQNWQQRLSLQYSHQNSHQKYLTSTNNNTTITDDKNKKRVWLHAVSVGETLAAAELIKELLKNNHQILLTQTTPSAHDIAQKTFKEAIANGSIQLQYFVYDCPYAVQTFLAHEKIDLTIIMETEFWPFLLAKLGELKIPTILANARLSKKSWKKLRRFLWMFLPLYQHYDFICAQSEMDGRRFFDLLKQGLKNFEPSRLSTFQTQPLIEKIKVLGNLKFDQNLNPLQVEKAEIFKHALLKKAQKQQIVVFASTREGEEIELLKSWFAEDLKNTKPLLMIVPRHLDRVSEIQGVIESFKYQSILRSELTQENISQHDFTQKIIIGNSMGEMPFYMALADVVVMGGTWGNFGGQNFLEAIMQQKATVIGPSIYNFMQIAKNAIKAKACVQTDIINMPKVTSELLIELNLAQKSEDSKSIKNIQNIEERQQHQQKFMQTYAGVLKQYKIFLNNYFDVGFD